MKPGEEDVFLLTHTAFSLRTGLGSVLTGNVVGQNSAWTLPRLITLPQCLGDIRSGETALHGQRLCTLRHGWSRSLRS